MPKSAKIPLRPQTRFSGRLFFAVLLLTAVLFLPSLKNGFVGWDDGSHILQNPAVRSLSAQNIRRIFTTTVQKTYIPLTTLSFALEYHFAGYDPFVFHLTNLVLHLAVTACVFLLAVQLGLSQTAAFFAALLFGIHPMHVESVSWATERKDVLYSVFYILSLMSYVRYLDAGSKARCAYYAAALGFGFLSLLAKPMALSLPLVLFLVDWYKKRKRGRELVWDKLMFFAYTIPIAWITYSLHVRVPGKDPFSAGLIWMWSLSFYIKTFLFPLALVPLHQLAKPVSLTSPEYWEAFFVVGVTAGLVYRFRGNRLLVFAGLFCFLSIFFLLRYDDVSDITIVADRFMYLPSLGLCLLAGRWAGGAIISRQTGFRNVSRLVVIAVFLFCGVKTFLQQRIWNSTLGLWNYVIAKYPDQPLAYNNRSMVYEERGDYKRALDDQNKSLELEPDNPEAINNRGLVYLAMGRLADALGEFNRAVELDDKEPKYFNNRGLALARLQRRKEAMEDYNRALSIYDEFEDAYNNRGVLYLEAGEFDSAQRDFERALLINPENSRALNNFGNLYRALQNPEKAIAFYTKAIDADPKNEKAYNNRAVMFGETGKTDLALADLDRAVALNGRYSEAYSNRAITYEKTGEMDAALRDYTRAVELQPLQANALRDRGAFYLRTGQTDRAFADFSRAIDLEPGFAPAYFLRSQVLLETERLEEALRDAQKASDLGYQVPSTYLSLIKMRMSGTW